MEEQSKMKKATCYGKTHLIYTLHFWMNFFIYVVVMVTISITGLGYIPPVKQGFYCGDPSLSYKYNGETISAVMLCVISFLISFVMIVPTEMLRQKSSVWKAKQNCLCLFKQCGIGVTLVFFITSIAKVLLGAHRPQFFDICQPDMAENCTVGTYVHTFTCTTYKISSYSSVTDSSLSFPSGHSSISCFVGMYVSSPEDGTIKFQNVDIVEIGFLQLSERIPANSTIQIIKNIVEMINKLHGLKTTPYILRFGVRHLVVTWYIFPSISKVLIKSPHKKNGLSLLMEYVLQERMPKHVASLTKPFLIAICITYSMLCSLSRITDRMHHWWDVLGGATLGVLVALYSIRLVHQRLQDLDKHQSISNPV